MQSTLRYTILDVPPWYECALLGFQVGLSHPLLPFHHLSEKEKASISASVMCTGCAKDMTPDLDTSMRLQHYLTMLGSTVLIPFLIVPPMGGTPP